MAYRSESALAAAICPKSNGSSTTGVKKSVVTTSARRASIRHTAASSGDPSPTSRSGFGFAGKRSASGRRTWASASALSLEAQPAQLAMVVSRISRPLVARGSSMRVSASGGRF